MLRIWILCLLFLLLFLVTIGGITRLTDSGLSITQWKPVYGIIPPLNDEEWEMEFEQYKRIPQYTKLNAQIDLSQFKSIFWWEWIHRFVARLTAVFLALPLLFFFLAKKLKPQTGKQLLGILILTGGQGVLGWWMVVSGLTERTDVSQYRLCLHLLLAGMIFAWLVAVWKELKPHKKDKICSLHTRNTALLILCLVFVQFGSGAIVAGLDAGLSYNQWPLMDGFLIPPDLFPMHPLWRNFFENPKTVQFTHRCLALILLLTTFWHMITVQRNHPGTRYADSAITLTLIMTTQFAMGIYTLLMQVPLIPALLHQLLAFLMLGKAMLHWHDLKK